MKMIVIYLAVLGLLTVSCKTSRTAVTGKNVDPDVISLKNERTFGWTSDVDKIPDDREFVSPNRVFEYEATRKMYKEAIEYELNVHGYKMRDSGTTPGMLVSFMILKRTDTLRRTRGVLTVQGSAVINQHSIEYVRVLPGTLIINITDNKANKMVWQGFASGIIKPNHVNDKQKIRQAVSAIFKQFNYNANTK